MERAVHSMHRPRGRRFTGSWRQMLLGIVVASLYGVPPVWGQMIRQPVSPKPRENALAAMGAATAASGISVGTPLELATAMGIPPADIIFASLETSDAAGTGVGTKPLGNYFPRQGSTFAILATGLASSAELPNDSGSTSTELSGLNNSQGNDMVQLHLRLRPPAAAKCLAFDFAFYSEEFPEFVGSRFNDAFTAEIVGGPDENARHSDLQIVNNQVIAPFNFAFDTNGNPIAVNTVFGVSPNTGTTYDGATPLLRAVVPLEPSMFPTLDLFLTIQDLGDSIYDSAVFLDGFAWLFGVNCTEGAFPDTDGDGLLDDWEKNGIDVDGDGTIDLDLPAMGADPRHKDIFIEVDYMVDKGFCIFGFCHGGHSHKPEADALGKVIQAFANAPVSSPDGRNGITLHIDAGPDTVMNPLRPNGDPARLWGAASRSDALAHVDQLGSCTQVVNGNCVGTYEWTDFDTIKQANFSVLRRDVFHYVIFGHQMGAATNSGISRGVPASDFLVTLGAFPNHVGTVDQQAGTLMHELGHNLGLCHGGPVSLAQPDQQCNVNYKPNYLSIMNYFFQMRGLRLNGVDGNFDYSRFGAIAPLRENALVESVGLNGGPALDPYGTRYYCAVGEQIVNSANGPINWNCDGETPSPGTVGVNINGGAYPETLRSYDDWTNIRFDGGAVGKLGQAIDLPMETEAIEISQSEDAKLSTPFAVCVGGPGDLTVLPGHYAYEFEIRNIGENMDTYSLHAHSALGWAALSTIPRMVTLSPGASTSISVDVNVPPGAPFGTTDTLVVTATSTANPLLVDSATTRTTVGVLDTDTDGASDIEESGPHGASPDFDGNDDGTPDRLQPNVVSLHASNHRDYVTFVIPEGTLFMHVRAVPNPSPSDAPRDVLFPYGFFEFTIAGLAPGGSVTLTMLFPGPTTGFYKWGPTPEDPGSHWYSFLFDGVTGAGFSGKNVVLTFKDGMRGDDDLNAANGSITDQGGPTVSAAAPVPVLSLQGILVLLGLLIAVGFGGMLCLQKAR